MEPADPSEPVHHEVSEFKPGDNGWHLLAASVRGKLHAHKGLWRDDAFGFDRVEGWTLIALADGAGSARLARVGARVACAEALQALREGLSGYRLDPPAGEGLSKTNEEDLRAFLVGAARRARAGLEAEAARRQCPLRDLNTTFLLVIRAPFQSGDLVGTLQVGDGAIAVFTADEACSLAGVADHGQYSSETCFLTTPGIEEQLVPRVRFALYKKSIRCLAVMCDGVSDDFFPESKRLIELFVGSPIQELKTRQGESVWGVLHKERGLLKGPGDPGPALASWLKYEKRGSSDDRTLVLMYRRDPL